MRSDGVDEGGDDGEKRLETFDFDGCARLSKMARVRRASASRFLVCTSTEIHRTEHDLPREIETIPELGIVDTESDCVPPNSGDVLCDVGQRTHSGCGREKVC